MSKRLEYSDPFYAQSLNRAPTMTVADLIKCLSGLDPAAPIVFKTGQYGVFGGDTMYPVRDVSPLVLERKVHKFDACDYEDDETGELIRVEPYEEVSEAWQGVIIR